MSGQGSESAWKGNGSDSETRRLVGALPSHRVESFGVGDIPVWPWTSATSEAETGPSLHPVQESLPSLALDSATPASPGPRLSIIGDIPVWPWTQHPVGDIPVWP
ncbi:hypothetical protein NDU88_011240 [Pleurodeles waltl]|uniref:Uncharacterized protein n=1 Tax=Pleurodeles waltl TaxID=8319 RepID=A0AAV7Q0A0_PLEWA|nr:hypothetical protein NDU88_011240 [Pleurodeles waltl]